MQIAQRIRYENDKKQDSILYVHVRLGDFSKRLGGFDGTINFIKYQGQPNFKN